MPLLSKGICMETSKLAPRGAIRNYAGGGEISPWSLRGMAGAVSNAFADTPEQKTFKEGIAKYKAEKAAAAATPAPTSTPAPGTISGYAGMTALQQREKAAGLKNGGVVKNCVTGGAIRGKGTATSDEIPIMASNGEFMIKASAVKKIGIEALEALNALGDAPDEKDSKAEAQREYGKPKGAVRKMSKGGYLDEERAATIAQIPTGQGSFPAPAPDGKDNTEIGRQVNNSLNALGGMGVVASVPLKAASTIQQGAMRAAPVLTESIPRLPAPQVANFVAGMGPNSTVHAGQAAYKTLPVANEAMQAGAKANQMAATTRAGSNASAGATALDGQPQPQPGTEQQSEYSRQMGEVGKFLNPVGMIKSVVGAPGYENPITRLLNPEPLTPNAISPTPAPQTGSSATIAPVPTAAIQPTVPVQPGTAPTDGTTPARLNGVDGKNVGYGATRFDLPGKSPLFTNMTDAAGLADNAKLMGRGAVTAQNQSAMDGIQARQDAGDQAARNKTQYDQEVAAANAVNKWQSERGMNARALASRRDNETARRGQDIQAGALRDSQKLAQDKFGLDKAKDGRESTASAMDWKSKQQLMDAQQEYLNAGDDPVKLKAAERKLITLGGKQGKSPTFHPGSRVKNVDGSETVTPAYVFDPSTGQAHEVQPGAQQAAPAGQHAAPTTQAEYNKLPKGAKYVHPDGTTRTKG